MQPSVCNTFIINQIKRRIRVWEHIEEGKLGREEGKQKGEIRKMAVSNETRISRCISFICIHVTFTNLMRQYYM